MSVERVRYEEDADGVYWVFDGERGKSQINLHAAMNDYEGAQRNAGQHERHDHIAIPGELADNLGSAGENEEAHTDAAEGGAGGPSGVGAQEPAAIDEGGGDAATGANGSQE